MFQNSQSTVVFKEDFSQLAFYELTKLGFNRKSIKAELVPGSCKTKTNLSNKDEATYSYSKDTSDAYRESILFNLKKKNKQVKIKKFHLTLHKL